MLERGTLLDGKYRVGRLLGEGGMGAVYEGVNVLIERRVAIKVLHARASRDPRAVERFSREARAAGLIGNDHILEILDLGVLPTGESFLVMEFLDGEPLSARLAREKTLGLSELRAILEQTLDGLRAAHRAGIVHRDLKPENLFLVREKAGVRDFVKIIDFGVSKFSETDGEMRMTETGALLGTPYYMSPEQARGADQVTDLSDLYSVGVIAYEALTGRRPYEGGTVNELLFKIVLSEAPSLSSVAPSLDRAFVGVIERAMARDPADRFESADAFLRALPNAEVDASRTLDLGTPAPLVDARAAPRSPREDAKAGRLPRAPAPAPEREAARAREDSRPPLPLHRSPLPLVLALVGLVAGAGVWLLVRGASKASEAPPASSARTPPLPLPTSELSTELPAGTPPPNRAPEGSVDGSASERSASPRALPSPPPSAPRSAVPSRNPPAASSPPLNAPAPTASAPPLVPPPPRTSREPGAVDFGY